MFYYLFPIRCKEPIIEIIQRILFFCCFRFREFPHVLFHSFDRFLLKIHRFPPEYHDPCYLMRFPVRLYSDLTFQIELSSSPPSSNDLLYLLLLMKRVTRPDPSVWSFFWCRIGHMHHDLLSHKCFPTWSTTVKFPMWQNHAADL